MNTDLTIDLAAYFTDPDGDEVTYIATQPQNVTVIIDNGTATATFVPDANFTVVNYVQFTAFDPEGLNVSSNSVSLSVISAVSEDDDKISAATTQAANVTASSITCNSCTDCTNKLNSGLYDTVLLTADITNHAGTCINFSANNVVFDGGGHTIDGDDSGTDYGIYLEGKSGNTVKNCVVTDFWYGIYLTGSSGNTIDNNTANSNTDDGIYLVSSSSNNLTGNTANSNNNYGIALSKSSTNNTLTNNTASNNSRGISLSSSSTNLIYNNYFNNTQNAHDDNGDNVWNIAKTPGMNIIGGPYLGGELLERLFWRGFGP